MQKLHSRNTPRRKGLRRSGRAAPKGPLVDCRLAIQHCSLQLNGGEIRVSFMNESWKFAFLTPTLRRTTRELSRLAQIELSTSWGPTPQVCHREQNPSQRVSFAVFDSPAKCIPTSGSRCSGEAREALKPPAASRSLDFEASLLC